MRADGPDGERARYAGAAAEDQEQSILVEVDPARHTATLTINRPKKLNAIDPACNLAMYGALSRLEDDPDVWVVIITGAGDRAFSTGGDLTAGSAPVPSGPRISFGGGLTGVAGRMITMTKPLIAAVHGYAIGGGFEIAMACDIIVASPDASFGLTEGRTGWISDSPAVHRIVHQLPHHVAMGLILTSNRLSADRALQHGLVNEISAPGGVMDTAQAWAATLTESSPLALRALKEAAIRGLDTGLETALATRWEVVEEFQATADRHEGAAAFREKRKPEWKGR